MKQGVLLFAHGARDPRWAEPFEAIAARVRASRSEHVVRLAFLELMTPTLAEAGAALALEGCARVDIVPLFLGAGGHVRKDLPELLEALRAAHPGVHWQLQPSIGGRAGVIEAMADAVVSDLGDDEP